MKKTYIEDSKGGGDSKKEAIKRFLTNMGHNISKSVLLESSSLRVVAATRSKKKETIEDSSINHNTSSWQQILEKSTIEELTQPSNPYSERTVGTTKRVQEETNDKAKRAPWLKKKCPGCRKGFNSQSKTIQCRGCDSFSHDKAICSSTSLKTDYLCLNCNSSKADPILKSAKNHSCTKCSESFRDSYNLKRHIERKHKSVDVPEEGIQSPESEAVVQKEVKSCNTNEPITDILSSKGCNLCKEAESQLRPMHICRYCKVAVCNLFCSKQDPNYPDNEMKRIHKKGKGCKMDNPPDKFRYKCPECHKMLKRIEVKIHMKENHDLRSPKKSNITIGIKCFDCKFRAPNLEAFKLHTNDHYRKEEQGFDCKCCKKWFFTNYELNKHNKRVHEKKEEDISLEELEIKQKPEIVPRIKQSIQMEDLEYDSDED